MSDGGEYTGRADSARLFVAIALPSVVRRELEAATRAARRLDELRWAPTEQLHATLRFIGETTVDRIPAIGSALATAVGRHSRFTIDVGGAGAFPSTDRARVVWIGVRESVQLLRLHERVETALATQGIEPDPRRFRPHVTLARVRRGPVPIGLARALHELRFEASFEIGAVSLMQSELGPKGARHIELASCPLADEITES